MKFLVKVLALVLFIISILQFRTTTGNRARVFYLLAIIASGLILLAAVLEVMFPDEV